MKVSSLEHLSLAVKNSGAQTIALQFPDGMLGRAHLIVKQLETEWSADFYILADSPYSECCVDFVAAKHVNAELIVHFGITCDFALPPGSVPVIFVVSEISGSWDTNIITEEIRKLIEGDCSAGRNMRALVIWGLEESYFLHNQVSSALKNLIEQNHLVFDDSGSFSGLCRNEISSDHCESFDNILYIGEDGPFFANIQLKYFMKKLFILSSTSTSAREIHRSDLNRMITRRYHVLSKVSSIEKVGIVVADLSSYNSNIIVDRIRMACISRGIQPYVISVGKITEAKLANISGLDFYVLVSCPYLAVGKLCPSLVPLITPYEFTLLLNDRLGDIFSGAHVSFSESLNFNLTSENIDAGISEGDQIIRADIMQQLSSFCERTFTGLLIDVENRDLEVHDGAFGIASSYHGEPKI